VFIGVLKPRMHVKKCRVYIRAFNPAKLPWQTTSKPRPKIMVASGTALVNTYAKILNPFFNRIKIAVFLQSPYS
jgi:hypothetical protein